MDSQEAEKTLYELNNRHNAVAAEFYNACVEYATHKFNHEQLLSTRVMIYKAKKANIGVEMCILTAMDDAEYIDRNNFKTEYYAYIMNKAKMEGLKETLEAIKSEKSSIQSLMKFQLENE